MLQADLKVPSEAVLPRLPEPKRVASEELLGPGGQIIIVHNGREYRLRQTHSGKLILTA